jgi:hypothetical protein
VQLLVELGQAVADLDRVADCPEDVVLVDRRDAEEGHNRVPMNFATRPP